MSSPQPWVSFVLPVLNSMHTLPDCLASIRRQTVEPERYEILVADGGSTDESRAIAGAFGCRMIEARGLMAEAAKQRAFREARGEWIVLLDADNEIASPDWLGRALEGLKHHPEALGFESYYEKHPRHSRLNRYLTGCLQISDPYARFLAGKPRFRSRDTDGTEVLELPVDGSYPTGANGFIFHRRYLANLESDQGYHEAVFFPRLIRAGHRTLLKNPDCRVFHHYVTTWGDYFRKRQRAMIIYMLRLEETRDAWDASGRASRKWMALLWFGTLLGPLVAGIGIALRKRDPDWLLHPVAGWVSTFGNLLGVLRYRRAADRKRRIGLTQTLHDRTGGRNSDGA
ncbi:MAG: glycosyltransferase family 2 protein [Kiritimatiellia bacterium]|nr:glycosyltransferase family 2 protein [Kiritimatiellia bacterium]